MMGISVIVCCYNSAGRIRETIKFLANQNVPTDIPWEVIIVNNASTDSTSNDAISAWKENHGPSNFKVVDELTAGLSFARQKGIETSKYDFLIFCDDDNHLEADYVKTAFTIMMQNPEIGIAGAWVKPKLPFYPGKWIELQYPALAIGKQKDTAAFVDWVFGAGMVFRKKIFDDLVSQNIRLLLSDRKGKSQTSGGDAEMCQLAKFIGYKVYFSPDLVLHHQIEQKRLTKKSFIKANLQNLQPTVHLFILDNLIKDKNRSWRSILLQFLRERLTRVGKSSIRLMVGRHSFLNFLEVYIGSVLISWVVANRSAVIESYYQIKTNLYHD